MNQQTVGPGSPKGLKGWPWKRWARSKLLHQWIQSGGILVAAAWGLHTFFWKNVLVPLWAPALLHIEVSLKPLEAAPKSSGATPMAVEVKATNPSTHELHLLSNNWRLVGLHRQAVPPDPAFQQSASAHLLGKDFSHLERGVRTDDGALIAVGRLFKDSYIEAGETIHRRFVVNMPREYGAAEVEVTLPTLFREPNQQLFDGRRLEWAVGTGEMVPLLCAEGASRAEACEAVTRSLVHQRLEAFDRRSWLYEVSEQLGWPTGAGGP